MNKVVLGFLVSFLVLGSGLAFLILDSGNNPERVSVSDDNSSRSISVSNFGSESFRLEYTEDMNYYADRSYDGYNGSMEYIDYENYPHERNVYVDNGQVRKQEFVLGHQAYYPPDKVSNDKRLYCRGINSLCEYFEDSDLNRTAFWLDNNLLENFNASKKGEKSFEGRQCDYYEISNISVKDGSSKKIVGDVHRLETIFEHVDINVCIDQQLGFISNMNASAVTEDRNFSLEMELENFEHNVSDVKPEIRGNVDLNCQDNSVSYTKFYGGSEGTKIIIDGLNEGQKNISVSEDFEPWSTQTIHNFEEPDNRVAAIPYFPNNSEEMAKAGDYCIYN